MILFRQEEVNAMMEYCDACGKEVEAKIISRQETFNVCGEEITVEAQLLVCAECGEELFSEELDSATLVNAYNEYRRKHKLLLPDEIKEIREQYGLSQRSFARLLNWGDKTICRYENGSVQDKAHNSLLLFLREPENMRTYLTENEIALDERQRAKLLGIVEKLEQDTKYRAERIFFDLFFSRTPCEENGFKGFDYEKLCAMVLFFAHKSTELLKTKLMKLLNYSDMIFYKENGISMSGLRYAHLPYGPVPENFDMLFGKMATDHIAHIEVVYDNGYEKHQVIPECDIPEDILSAEELEVLERIYVKFKDFGSVDISNYSHKEKGYSSTKQGEIISYSYAKDIQLN
jgi:putative zinc finger/helix-turn-helix YgiT family protein